MKLTTKLSALALGAALTSGVALWAQQDEKTTPPEMPEACREMMARHQQMQERAKAMDQRLDELVARMNTANGDAKTAATAAVVSELVAQRKQMRADMMPMCGGMMEHMMGHDSAGGTMEGMEGMEHPRGAREQGGKGMHRMMNACPMMRMMMGGDRDASKEPGG